MSVVAAVPTKDHTVSVVRRPSAHGESASALPTDRRVLETDNATHDRASTSSQFIGSSTAMSRQIARPSRRCRRRLRLWGGGGLAWSRHAVTATPPSTIRTTPRNWRRVAAGIPSALAEWAAGRSKRTWRAPRDAMASAPYRRTRSSALTGIDLSRQRSNACRVTLSDMRTSLRFAALHSVAGIEDG